MGKCGGRELNYVSDVDVVFVAEPADAATTRLAGRMMRVAGEACFEVDANLRPEGRQGALVRTLDGHVAYYKRWAKTWEFQALLKARPVAGDPELGEAYAEAVAPLVWSASGRAGLRRRRAGHAPAGGGARPPRPREPGSSSSARAGCATSSSPCSCSSSCTGAPTRRCARRRRSTRCAALSDGGYVGRDDGANLAASYRFLRLLEHRLQLQRMRRTHLLPAADDTDALRWLARAARLRPDGRHDVVGVLMAEWTRNARRVRRLHEKLFYRPLLTAVSRLLGRHRAAVGEGGRRPARRAGLGVAGGRAGAPARADRRVSPAPRRSSRPCCRCCSTSWPAAPTPTAACWPTGGCPRRSPTRRGTCGCCATRGWSRSG